LLHRQPTFTHLQSLCQSKQARPTFALLLHRGGTPRLGKRCFKGEHKTTETVYGKIEQYLQGIPRGEIGEDET
jgi:hypothetical protein